MHLHSFHPTAHFVPGALVIVLVLQLGFARLPLGAQPTPFVLVGLEGQEVHGLLWDPGSNALFAGTPRGIWRAEGTDARDLQWQLALRDSNQYAWWQFAADGHGNVYAGNSDESFARSSDSGRTWTVNRNDAVMSRFGIIKSIGVDDIGHVYVGTTPAVWCSSDSGRTWANRSTGLPPGFPDVQAFHRSNSGSFFAVTGGIVGAHIYRSVNHAARWELAREGTDINHYIGSMVSTGSGTILSYAFREGVLRSTDDGGTWEVIPIGIPDTVSVTAMAHVADRSFIAVNPPELRMSSNDGRNWFASYARPSSMAYDLSAGPDDRCVFAATDSGVFAWNMYTGGVPSAFTARPFGIDAWPVPASDELHVAVREAPGVTISIVDAFGLELQRQRVDAGGAALFDVTALPPGPYVLRAVRRGGHDTRPIIIVR